MLLLFACATPPDEKPADTDPVSDTAADTDTDTDTDSDTDTDTDSDTDTVVPAGRFGGDRATDAADLVLTGSTVGEDVGRSIFFGDVDADGDADLVAGTIGANTGAGGARIVPLPTTSGAVGDLGTALDATWPDTQYAGRSVGVADLDGDGRADVALGSPYVDASVYVSFAPFDADHAVDDGAYVLEGRDTLLGHGMDAADVTGDGQADIAVGAYGDSSGGTMNGGAVYVVPGPVAPGTAQVASEAVATVWGTTPDNAFGRFVRSGGDIDGDGISDLLVAEPYARGAAPSAGVVHVILGGWTGERDASDSDARLLGESAGDIAGEELAFGDIDGDGLDDAIVAAYGFAAGDRPGALYAVAAPSGELLLADAAMIVRGDGRTDRMGSAIAARDADGDGHVDLLAGATGIGSGGQALLYYGPLAGEYGASDADATFTAGVANIQAGEAVAFGDVTGDGQLEVLVGANWDNTGASVAGAIYGFSPE